MELKYLTEQRSENQEKMQKILDTAKLEKRALSEEEISKFNELKKFHWFLGVCKSASGKGLHVWTKITPI